MVDNIEITKREILVSIIIVLVMVALGFFISAKIHDSVSVSNEKYFKALKVKNDPSLFNHAINTEIGHILSYGEFRANDAVKDKLIDGEYFSILKIKERYVMKTRTVTYTDANGNTKTKTETYWEWDEVKRESFNTETFAYLGKEFNFDKVKFNHHEYNDTIKKGLNVRYKYYTIPREFKASLYSMAKEKTIKDNIIFPSQSIDELIEKKENSADNAVIWFWIIWVVAIILVVFGFVALENRMLNE